jgi:AraC-like DNA-binding protein
MLFDDPTEFEDFLAPIGGDVLIRPATGSSFNADICLKKLDAVGLFSVSADSFKVVKEPQGDFYGLTVPLSTPFAISERGQNQEYEASSAHLLQPGHAFDLTAKRKTHFLVCNFFVDPVHGYSQRLLQSDNQEFSSPKSDVSFFSQAGSDLLRSVARTWSDLNNKTAVSKITLKEREDDLLASFVEHSNEGMNFRHSFKGDASYHLRHAEDFICSNLDNPITRDQLAEVSGCSIRTLSRSFEKKYGIGPMAFIKQRRLDAAYLDLLSAKSDTTSVTQVAINYGFSHMGKFAIEYGKAFGETPSTTLTRM